MSLKFIKPRETLINKDIFKCAEFWLSKGYLIQNNSVANSNKINVKENSKNIDVNNVALDYYLSGVATFSLQTKSNCIHLFFCVIKLKHQL